MGYRVYVAESSPITTSVGTRELMMLVKQMPNESSGNCLWALKNPSGPSDRWVFWAAAAAARTEAEAEGDCTLVVAERRAKANSSPRGPCCPGRAASHSLLSSSRGCAATPHPSTAPAHPTSRSLPLSFTPGPARPRPSSVPAAMAEASGAREI
uniref:uncharacterized protein LOC105758165 n=1 Tax=Odobenus rosmarus divergens TaxID=9708 RepID=UPI00063CB812|nr:PREDICTED: uncharacterized protein LOC105758165 [Odobenus rosmarus divergens]